MTKTLEERLHDAKGALHRTNKAIERHPGKLPADVEWHFREVTAFGADVDHWIGMLQARRVAFALLTNLENTADPNDCVALGTTRTLFRHVRLIGVQSYLTTTWALADRMTGLIGRVLCPPHLGSNPKNPPQLVSHFVRTEKNGLPAGAVSKSVRRLSGWPIAILYAIRNHVVHDGAQFSGADFFEGPTAASAFRVSPPGWQLILKDAECGGVGPSDHHRPAAWPSSPMDDLRVVLAACEGEMDDALGVLLGSACGLLMSHVGCALGED